LSFQVYLQFDVTGLIPAIVQEQKTGLVLMMAGMNHASLKKTIETTLSFVAKSKPQRPRRPQSL
jgi:phosphoribosyl-AMP cyclohydrolase